MTRADPTPKPVEARPCPACVRLLEQRRDAPLGIYLADATLEIHVARQHGDRA